MAKRTKAPAVEPVTPSIRPKPVTPTERLRAELDAAHLCTERLFSLLTMVVESLYARGVDSDFGLAICLENAVEVELNPAMDRISGALALVPKVTSNG